MFVGHYGVSFATKGTAQAIPLWLLFIAVQFVDVLWAVFVPLGIEKVRIVPGITASNPLDLYYMPYTHSLLGCLGWSVFAFVTYRFFVSKPSHQDGKLALFLALAVFSHWVLDLIVHRPDLPLYDDTLKVGFGLWNHPVPAFLLETLILLGGMWIYLRSTTGSTIAAKYGMPLFGVAMLVTQSIVFFGPPPRSPSIAAATALCSYVAFAWIAYWRLDKKRSPRASVSA